MSNLFPTTRQSLILRLHDAQDDDAWREFLTVYEPLVRRLAQARGLQDADARNLTQEVLLAVSSAVERWDPSRERGRFRDWLYRIARNKIVNALTRPNQWRLGSGDSGVAELLRELPDPASEETQGFDLEYQREVFRLAAERVRGEVTESTWRAFWMTSVEGATSNEAAERLGLSIGAVHIARSRVRGRLRRFVAKYERNEMEFICEGRDDR